MVTKSEEYKCQIHPQYHQEEKESWDSIECDDVNISSIGICDDDVQSEEDALGHTSGFSFEYLSPLINKRADRRSMMFASTFTAKLSNSRGTNNISILETRVKNSMRRIRKQTKNDVELFRQYLKRIQRREEVFFILFTL